MASNASESLPAGPNRAPLIGITSTLERARSGVWNVRASFLPQTYVEAVTRAGGVAIVLPPQRITPETAADIVAALDGVIFSGGSDVDPARYGQEPHPRTSAPHRVRDDFESELLSEVLRAELPFLAVCRGAQLLNVELGGDLLQHLPDVVGDNRYQLGNGQFNVIDVEVDAGSRIADVLGDDRVTNAHLYHHQAIGRLGSGLAVTSRTEDGIPQSIELTSRPFALAVQWHPEENPNDRRLFEGLVAAAARGSGPWSPLPRRPAPEHVVLPKRKEHPR